MFFLWTVFHHDKTDRQGLITETNLVVGDNGAINPSVKERPPISSGKAA